MNKKYYDSHREELREYWKNYRKRRRKNNPKAREKMNRHTKAWKEKNQDKVRSYQRKYQKEWSKKDRKVKRAKIRSILGTKCVVCGSTKRIIFHEIHGKSHDQANLNYTLKHIEDFVSLCWCCHIALHNLARNGKLNLKEFLRLRKILRN